jgi:hypothetical protein
VTFYGVYALIYIIHVIVQRFTVLEVTLIQVEQTPLCTLPAGVVSRTSADVTWILVGAMLVDKRRNYKPRKEKTIAQE